MVVTVALLITGATIHAQQAPDDEIYVCRDKNGEIVAIQVDPCPEPPKPVPKPREKKPVPQMKRVAARPKPRPQPESQPKPTALPRETTWQLVPRSPVRLSPARPGLGRQSFPTRLTGANGSAGFSTPERTWRSFLAATAVGDRTAAAACFTPAAIERLGADLPLADLRALVASFTRIESEGSVGPYWSIYGVRADARPKWILFEEMPGGEWKISGM